MDIFNLKKVKQLQDEIELLERLLRDKDSEEHWLIGSLTADVRNLKEENNKLKEEINSLKGRKKRKAYKKRVLKVTKKSAPLIVLTYRNISQASKVVDSKKHESWLCNAIITEEKRTGSTSVVLELGDYVVHSEQIKESE